MGKVVEFVVWEAEIREQEELSVLGKGGRGGGAEIMMVGKFSVTEYIENRLMKDGMRIEEKW